MNTFTVPSTGRTSAYPWYCPGHWLLAPSCPLVTCGWLPARCLTISENRQRVIPFRVSIFRGFRSVLYAASLDSSGYLVPLDNVAEGDDSHFGPACQPIWQGLHDDASNVPSLALTMTTCSAHRRVRLAAYRLSLHALRRLRASRPPLEGAVTCPPQG